MENRSLRAMPAPTAAAASVVYIAITSYCCSWENVARRDAIRYGVVMVMVVVVVVVVVFESHVARLSYFPWQRYMDESHGLGGIFADRWP